MGTRWRFHAIRKSRAVCSFNRDGNCDQISYYKYGIWGLPEPENHQIFQRISPVSQLPSRLNFTECTALTNGVKPSPRPHFTLTLFKASALAHHRCASLWMEGLFVQNWNPFLLYLLLFWLICYEWFCFGIDTHNGWIKLKARYHFKLAAAPRASDHGVDSGVNSL